MTKTKTVTGLIINGLSMRAAKITCRVTVDSRGKSLSLSDDDKIMLQIPLEAVADMIKPAGEWRK